MCGSALVIRFRLRSKLCAEIAIQAGLTGFSRSRGLSCYRSSDRTWLKAQSKAPSNWCVWIGRYRWQRSMPQWTHLSSHVLNTDTLPDALTDEIDRPNTQTTTFCLGEMFAFAMSSEFPEIPRGWDWRTAPSANFKLHRIWPMKQPEINWPPATMTDAEAQAYPVAFAHYMDDLALRGAIAPP